MTAVFFLTAFCGGPLFSQEEEPLAEMPEEPSLEDEAGASGIEIPEEFEGVQEIRDFESKMDSDQDFDFSEPQNAERAYSSFLNSVKQIRMLNTDTDVFLAVHKESGKRELSSFANGKMQRRFYDADLRLDKVEYWTLSGSSAQSVLERVVTYNPPKKEGGLYSIFEKNYSNSTETRTFFHPNGQIKSRRKNYFDQDGALTSFEIYTCSYDSKWRSVQERLQKYNVVKNDVDLSGDELYVTKYSGEETLEKSYYKNSILRVRTFYLDGKDDEFVRATYFDGGIIVRDFYKGNIKVSSTIDNGERSR